MSEYRRMTDTKPTLLTRLLSATAVLPIAVFTLIPMLPTAVQAANIEYAFSPGATILFSDGNREFISGRFTFNPVGFVLSDVDITIAPSNLEADTYTVPAPPAANYASGFTACDAVGAACLSLFFTYDLTGHVDPLASSGDYQGFTIPDGATHPLREGIDAATGFASPVPEPSSIAIVGAALGLIGLSGRACRKR